MEKLRIVEIVFDNELNVYEISTFRGAIANKVGLENILFHNHLGDNFRYSYPLIQYKTIGKKAAVVCIEQGVDEIYHLFEKPNWKIFLHDKEIDLKVAKLNLNTYNMNVWDKYFSYSLNKWIGLNNENYQKYESAAGLAEKIAILENVIVGNILSFAKGIGWYIEPEKKIEVKIVKINSERISKYKKMPLKTFDLEIKTNVFLPPHIGLGKAASNGYGVVYKYNNEKNKI